MNELIFDETIFFDQDDENYMQIIENDKNFCKTCREKIDHNRVIQDLEKFTFGYINISKLILYRHLHEEEILKELGDNHYDTSSSEDEDGLDHNKIIIKSFVICTLKTKYTNKFSLEINILCGRLDNQGLGSNLLRLVLQYCIDNEIMYSELEATAYDLVSYYESFGFVFIKRNLDSYYMERKNY